MKKSDLRPYIVLAVLLGASCLVACQPGDVERGTPATGPSDSVLPGTDALADWEMVSEPENYGPDNLWDYINGQAEFYLNYGFLRVDTAEYRAESGSPSVVVEIYQMASPEEAFGIYAAERNPDDRSVEIGSGGYLGSNVLNFWQEKNYIKLMSFEAGAGDEDALTALARGISELSPAGVGVPEVFSYFPEEGRVEASERYFPRGFLGQAYLNRTYRVDYAVSGGVSFQLFLVELESNDEARAVLARYADFLRSQGRGVELVDGESATTVLESGAATVIFAQDTYLGGVLDATSLEHGRDAAEGLAARLASLQ